MAHSPDDHDSFRAVTKRRILDDMLGKVGEQLAGEWKVLIVDRVTVKVVSSACGMSDLTGQGVSLVENIALGRQPQPHLEAVYFITPSPGSVAKLIADFDDAAAKKKSKNGGEGRGQMYRKAHVFFSSPLPPAQLEAIKSCKSLVEALGSLVEFNLEYFTKDSRTFVTDQPGAMEVIFGGSSPSTTAEFNAECDLTATRLATLMAALREFPTIRYKAAKNADGAVAVGGAAAAVATKVHRAMLSLASKSSSSSIPTAPTCDLLILDRSFDPIAPIVHEWTYEAMVHDLLPVSPLGVYRYTIETNTGPQEKDAVLGEADPLWVELRHMHIAAVLNTLAEKAKAFSAGKHGGRLTGEASTGSIKKVVENLPKFMVRFPSIDYCTPAFFCLFFNSHEES